MVSAKHVFRDARRLHVFGVLVADHLGVPIFCPSRVIPSAFQGEMFPVRFDEVTLKNVYGVEVCVLTVGVGEVSGETVLPIYRYRRCVGLPQDRVPRGHFSAFCLDGVCSPPPVDARRPRVGVVPIRPFCQRFRVQVGVVVQRFSYGRVLGDDQCKPIPRGVAVRIPLPTGAPTMGRTQTPAIGVRASPFQLPKERDGEGTSAHCVPRRVPRVPFPYFHVRDVRVVNCQSTSNPRRVGRGVADVLALTSAVVRRMLSSRVQVIGSPHGPMEIFLLRVLPGCTGHLRCVSAHVGLIRRGKVAIVMCLPPIIQDLVSSAVKGRPFARVYGEGKDVPQALFPAVGDRVGIVCRRFDPCVRCVQFSLRSKENVVVPVQCNDVLRRRPVDVYQDRRYFREVRFFAFGNVIVERVFCRRADNFVFFELVFVVFRCLFRFTFINYDALRYMLRSTKDVTDLRCPNGRWCPRRFGRGFRLDLFFWECISVSFFRCSN